MEKYFVNKRKDDEGDNEVHKDGCYWLTLVVDKDYLGMYYGCSGAVLEANRRGTMPTVASIAPGYATLHDRLF